MAIRLLRTEPQQESEVAAASSATGTEPPTSNFALIGSWVIAIGGLAAAAILTEFVTPPPFAPGDGFSALALFYIAAQAIERFLEPFTGLIKKAPATGQPPRTKKAALRAVRSAIGEAYQLPMAERQLKVQEAANWQAVVDSLRNETALWAWSGATALGAFASALLGLHLMRAVGASGVPVALDVIVSGLILGGGSKALHDLIKNIEKSKEYKEDPAEKV